MVLMHALRLSAARVLPLALLLAIALSFFVTTGATAYVYKVPPQTEDCFSELVEAGTTVSVSFTVTHGGKLDIDSTISSQDMATGQITQLKAFSVASEGTNEWVAPSKGAMPFKYQICFSNKMARWTPKWVSFEFFKMLPASDDGISGEHNKEFQHIEVALHSCANRVFNMRSKMTKLATNERDHRDKLESTVNWIVWGSIMQCLLLIALALFEFFYLKSFLAVRAVVRI